MTKTIKIQRKEVRRYGVHPTLMQDRVATIGSYLTKTGSVGTGLSFEEVKRIMPGVIATEPNDPKFRSEVDKYFNNMMIPIPYEGRELEIGIDTDTSLPVNIVDWLRYKFVLNHPQVALSKKDADSSQTKVYYLEDDQADSERQSESIIYETKAAIEFAKLVEDKVKFDWVLRELSFRYPEIGSISKLISLTSDKKNIALNLAMKKNYKTFLDIVNDEDIKYKAEIASLIDAKIVDRVGNQFIYGSEPIGELNHFIAYLKNPNNSETYATMLAKLRNLDLGLKDYIKEAKKKA
jgi:hypothetical protein